MSKFAREVGCLVIAAIIFCLPIMVYRFITSGNSFLVFVGGLVGFTVYIALFSGLILSTEEE